MEENNKEKKGQSVRVLALVLGILAVFVVFGAQLVNWQLITAPNTAPRRTAPIFIQ